MMFSRRSQKYPGSDQERIEHRARHIHRPPVATERLAFTDAGHASRHIHNRCFEFPILGQIGRRATLPAHEDLGNATRTEYGLVHVTERIDK